MERLMAVESIDTCKSYGGPVALETAIGPPLCMGVHNNGTNNCFPLPPQTDYAQWHNYSLLWTAGKVT
jgi:hypothetical protein